MAQGEQVHSGATLEVPMRLTEFPGVSRLTDILIALARASTRSDVVETVRSTVRRLIGADGIAFVVREDGRSHYLAEDALSPLWAGQRFPLEACISGQVMLSGETIVIADVLADPRVPVEAYRQTFVGSLAMVPVGSDAAIGAYWARRGTPEAGCVETLEVIARACLAALDKAALVEELQVLRQRAERDGAGLAAPVDVNPALPEPDRQAADALAAFEHLPVAAWIADRSGKLLQCNKAWRAYTGGYRAAAVGEGWLSHIDPEQMRLANDAWQRQTRSGEPVEFVFSASDAEGNARSYLSRAVPYKDADGRIVRWIGLSSDVTSLAEAERKAEASARLLRDVIDHIPSAIYIKDREGRFTLANRATLEVMGLAFEEIADRNDHAWLESDQADAMQAMDRDVFREGATIEAEERVGFDDHGARVFLSRKSPLRGPDGEIIGLIGSSVDITGRKRIEAALADREAHLRRVLNQHFAFVAVTDVDGTLQFANSPEYAECGALGVELQGRKLWESPWWSHSDEAVAQCREAITKAASGEVSQSDVTLRLSTGSLANLNYQAGPLRDEAGNVTSVLHSAVSVERDSTDGALQAALVGELHGRVANLFAMVSSVIQVASAKGGDLHRFAAALTGSVRALEQAQDLVRPDLGALEHPAEAELRALVCAVIAPHGEGRFDLSVEAMPLGSSAVTPLTMALRELVTNAVKFGALSTAEGAVGITARRHGDQLRLYWNESGGPRVPGAPRRVGFGSRIVDMCIASQLAGKVNREWHPGGLEVQWEIPLAGLVGGLR